MEEKQKKYFTDNMLLSEAKRIEEHTNKKIILTDLMLQKYYERLNELALYNRQKQLEKAQAEQGRIIDIEVR